VATDQEIREGIGTVVQAAAPLAVVFPWWCLGFDTGRWPGLVVSANDQDRPHGWVITRSAEERSEVPGGLFDVKSTYQVWAFHYYATGNEDANSEDLFSAEIDAVATALTPTSVAGVRLEPLQFPIISIFQCGQELLHVAKGQLVASCCC
jgi:hypothetical protein